MKYNDIKQFLLGSTDLAGLDDQAIAALFWRGEEQTFDGGAVIYAEGATLDDTFCLLVAGELVVEKGGEVVGSIFEGQIFGEMAYFTNQKVRTATVRAGAQALVLKFRLTQAEMRSTSFSALKKALARQTWEKFVNASQSWVPCADPSLLAA